MPNHNPKRYTRVVSVPLTDDQAARLDAGVTAGTTRSDLIRAAIDAHIDESPSVHTSSPGLTDIEQALERVLARHGMGSDRKPSPGRLASPDAVEALRDRLSGGPEPAGLPEGWALAGIRTDGLARLQKPASGLGPALAVVLAAAESGELDRADVARIVAARWDMHDGDRLQYDGGQLYREQAPERPRRSVQHRAD